MFIFAGLSDHILSQSEPGKFVELCGVIQPIKFNPLLRVGIKIIYRDDDSKDVFTKIEETWGDVVSDVGFFILGL